MIYTHVLRHGARRVRGALDTARIDNVDDHGEEEGALHC
jgi:hypothetical protein